MPHANTPVTLRLCETCENGATDTQRAALQDALEAAGVTARVRLHPCLGACDAPVSLSLQAPAAATYVFSGIDPSADIPAIVATVGAYLDAPGGWIDDAHACGRLRFCLRSRVPALDADA